MRNVMKRIALLSATLLIAALPVLADESAVKPFMEPAQDNGKDLCLLVAANSCDRVGTIQSKITEIQNEINKGTAVYTPEELNFLQKRLDDANREMIDVYGGGS